MKIGIISDSHDHVKNLLQAVKWLNNQKVTIIYHCGDWTSPFVFEFFFNECQPKAKVKGVLGNNEGDRFRLVERIQQHKFPLTLEQHILEDEQANLKIAVYHGQDNHITQSLLDSSRYDLVLTGHTHQPLIEKKGSVIHVNPGTICDAARSQIIDHPTLAVFDTDSKQTEIINFLAN